MGVIHLRLVTRMVFVSASLCSMSRLPTDPKVKSKRFVICQYLHLRVGGQHNACCGFEAPLRTG